MVKDLIVIIVSATVLGFAIGVIVGERGKTPPLPCGQTAVSLKPADILQYKTIICSFAEKDQNYFCSPWEPAANVLRGNGR